MYVCLMWKFLSSCCAWIFFVLCACATNMSWECTVKIIFVRLATWSQTKGLYWQRFRKSIQSWVNPTSSGTVALASRNVLQPLAQVVCIHSMLFLPLVFYCACMCLILCNWYNLWNYNMKQKSRSQLCIMCLFFKFST